jgi:hypothetical protein
VDGTYNSGKKQVLAIVSRYGEDELQEDGHKRSRFCRFVSLDLTSLGCCIVFQLTWRLAISLAFAFLIFFLATKPAKLHFSFKVVGIVSTISSVCVYHELKLEYLLAVY